MTDETQTNEDYDTLLEEVEDRLEDLEYQIGEDEISRVKINEKLRDEFKDDKYKQVLIDLDINKENTGLKEISTNTNNNSSIFNKDDKVSDTLVKILLNPDAHIQKTEKRIRGWEEETPGQWKKKREYFLPSKEVILMLQFLEGIFLPQNIISKKNLTMKEFDKSMNNQLQKIRSRLENYPDKIVPYGVITYVTTILLNEVQVVRNAIETGRLGDLATDMIVGSHSEKVDNTPKLDREQILNALKG